VYDATRTEQEKLGAELARLDFLLSKGAVDFETYGRAVASVEERLGALGDEAGNTETTLSAFADEAARTLQDSFAQFLFDPFKGGLSGMVAGFTATLRQMAAEAAAAQIFDALSGGKGGWGEVFSGLLGAFSGRATGGPALAGVPLWVGERGRPELFVPSAPGRIYPANAGGSVTVNNNITLNAGAGGTVDRRSLQQIQAAAAEGSARAMRRNR
jgi:hypothetical protein